MLYGLYLSASGVMANSYRQDVIANNLANSETVGFKRDVAQFRQRLNAAQEDPRRADWSDSVFDGLGGGLLAMPTQVDFAQGGLQTSGSPLDVAIQGDGFFAVKRNDQTMLTRDGRFQINGSGQLTLAGGEPVLDANGQPITLSTAEGAAIDSNGRIVQNGKAVGQLGVFNVPDRGALTQAGRGLFSVADPTQLQPTDVHLQREAVEESNVDPTTEMADLMDSERQLEANANLIKIQDSTLQRLVNDVGKIG